jgi:hypothetical protein
MINRAFDLSAPIKTKFQELNQPPQDLHIDSLCESNIADEIGLMSANY